MDIPNLKTELDVLIELKKKKVDGVSEYIAHGLTNDLWYIVIKAYGSDLICLK